MLKDSQQFVHPYVDSKVNHCRSRYNLIEMIKLKFQQNLFHFRFIAHFFLQFITKLFPCALYYHIHEHNKLLPTYEDLEPLLGLLPEKVVNCCKEVFSFVPAA
jgi:hypothetical protein